MAQPAATAPQPAASELSASVTVPLAVAGFALTLVAVRESRGPRERRLDAVGAALVAAGLFALTFALIETNEHGWTSAEVLVLLAAAAVLLVAFVAGERRVADPMVPLDLFRPLTLFSRTRRAGCSSPRGRRSGACAPGACPIGTTDEAIAYANAEASICGA